MPAQNPIIVWFRRDLRLADNPALYGAYQSGKPIILLYILEEGIGRKLGAARALWLHHSLASLSETIEKIGGQLILKRGQSKSILDEIIRETGADEIHWNRRYEGKARQVDAEIKADLKSHGVKVSSHNANLLSEPWEVETKTGGYYKVFTPYWRAVNRQIEIANPLPAPENLDGYLGALKSDDLDDWALLPTRPDWGSDIIPVSYTHLTLPTTPYV